jgi:hypothetical protein
MSYLTLEGDNVTYGPIGSRDGGFAWMKAVLPNST